MEMIFNRHQIALNLNKPAHSDLAFELDLERNFFTEYGAIIPTCAADTPFVRVLRGEFHAGALTNMNFQPIINITHLGEIWVCLYQPACRPLTYQITTDDWVVSGLCGGRDASVALREVLRGCKTAAAAIKRLDTATAVGMYGASIFSIQEIGKRLTELKYTKPMVFDDLAEVDLTPTTEENKDE